MFQINVQKIRGNKMHVKVMNGAVITLKNKWSKKWDIVYTYDSLLFSPLIYNHVYYKSIKCLRTLYIQSAIYKTF